MPSFTCTCTCAHTHAYKRAYAWTCVCIHLHTCMHVHANICTCARKHACTCAHTHTCTRAHAQACSHASIRVQVQLKGPKGPRICSRCVKYLSVALLAMCASGFINQVFPNLALVTVYFPYGTSSPRTSEQPGHPPLQAACAHRRSSWQPPPAQHSPTYVQTQTHVHVNMSDMDSGRTQQLGKRAMCKRRTAH